MYFRLLKKETRLLQKSEKSETTMLDSEHPYLMKLELTVSYITSLSIKNLAIDEHKLPNVDDILHTVKR